MLAKIQDEADPGANILFGATVNENMNDKDIYYAYHN